MSSEALHVAREKLSRKTLQMHYAMTSLMEEFEAIDWYRQRADDTEDEELKGIILHNANDELEHAAMLLEWIRRNDEKTDEQLRKYLFTAGSILAQEHEGSGGANGL
jgi:hypothetical protein